METIILEGTLSCKAAIEKNARQDMILFVDEKKRTRDFAWIIRQAKARDIPVVSCPRQKIDEMTGSRSNGGMALQCQGRKLRRLKDMPLKDGFLCYIEGVEDPHNLGSVCRTLYAAGCSCLIIPERDWSKSETIIMRASAGTYEKLEIAVVQSSEDLLAWLEKGSVPLLAAERKDAKPLFGYTFPDTFCLAIGGAMRGLGKDIVQAAGIRLYIPYKSDMRAALDTPSAAAVFAFAYAGETYDKTKDQ